MGKIRTILGDINPEKMGVTNYHDHLITIGGGEVRVDKDLELDSLENAIQAMHKYKRAGGTTFVDMNPIDCGRHIEYLVQISEKTGVNIIACTGFQRGIYYEGTHWVYKYPVETIAELITQEITEGIEINNYNGPIVMRSKARAGVIKIGTEYNHIQPVEKRMIEAAAIAHKNTGAPISSHTERGTMGHEQLDLLEGFGVKPDRVILGHVDRNPDIVYHKELAARGAYLGYDGPSRIKYWPDSTIIELIVEMVEAGYGKQILLGGDNGRRSYWPEYGGGPGHCYILEKFVPRLKKAGLSSDEIDDILIHNPARIFQF